ncbi:hypothetical protein [Gelidibacter maritimus]|uniref:Chromosome partitioning protein ParA n=1 Tax=Gelidibacter maritimus TaxID=2761487 RepID=A0A7W2R2C7_9FLAO|nr:hypothetical protein [Gelidibacter maritimus]MBA6151647.1 hypothetical protein [Gelidibacter maritimus]
MIVNPQFFNYKIIIGSLIIGITALGIVSFNSYESSKSQQRFVDQEKKLVENELSDMISRYDTLNLNNTLLSEQLDSAKKSTESVLEQLRLMEGDIAVLTKVKSELSNIKAKNHALFTTVDSINLLNKRLESEKAIAYTELNVQQKVNSKLKKINKSLNSTIEKGALLTANSFSAKAFGTGINAASTTKAAHANRIDVCFTLAENTLTEKGMKDIYIQILDPLNNVIGDKGSVEFGKFLLFYSHKQHIQYNNDVIDVCTIVQAQKNDKPLAKGTYYVSVFHKERKLGGTQIELN